MTNGTEDRLSRIEAILERTAERQEQFQSQIEATRAIADSATRSAESAARSAQANSEACSELRQSNRDLRETLGAIVQDTYENLLLPMIERVDATTEQVNRLVDESQANHEEHQEWGQRFENLLADARADRQRADERQREWNQRFDEQLARMDQRAAANEAEHNAFRQNIQVLLAEIARLWNRLAG